VKCLSLALSYVTNILYIGKPSGIPVERVLSLTALFGSLSTVRLLIPTFPEGDECYGGFMGDSVKPRASFAFLWEMEILRVIAYE